MTATTSTKTKNMFAVRFRNDLKENSKLFLVSVFFNLLGLPLLAIAALMESEYLNRISNLDYYYNNDAETFAMISAVALILYIGMGIVIALTNFRYLYSKSIVDMNYSLPLNNKQRFCADYFSGLVIYFIPLIIGIILGLLIYGIGSQFIAVNEEIKHAIPHFFKSGFIVVIGMLMMYTLSVLAITFCGSTFEAIFSVAAVNGIIPAVIACVWVTIVNSGGFGLIDTSVFHSNVMFGTSPIGTAIFFFKYLENGLIRRTYYGSISVYSPEHYQSMYIRWLAAALIFTAVFFYIAYLIYKKRKAEDVAKPYISKFFFYLIMSLALFCGLSLLLSSDGNPVAAVIVGALFWFVMEVITRRGFKKFWTAFVGFGITVAASFGIIALCNATDGFGIPKKVPSANSIAFVTIENSDYYYKSNFTYDLTFTDKDVIEATIALHKNIINYDYNNNEHTINNNISQNDERLGNTINDQTSLRFTYCTKSGSIIERYYRVPSFMLSEMTTKKITSDEYANYSSEQLFLTIANSNTTYNNYYFSIDEAMQKMENGYLYISDKIFSNTKSQLISKENAVRLTDAYKKDLMEMTEDDLKNSEFLGYISDNMVLASFRNTLGVLDELGIKINDINIPQLFEGHSISSIHVISDPRIIAFFDQRDKNNRFIRNNYMYDYTEIKYEVDSMCSIDLFNYGTSGGYLYRLNDNESVNELMRIATPVIIGEKPLAALYFDNLGSNNVLYIPNREGYHEILDKALDSMDIIPEEELYEQNDYNYYY